jgi:hypothetical protein
MMENSENKNLFYEIGYGKLLTLLIIIFVLTGMCFSFKFYSDLILKTVFNKREVLNKCFFNSDNNIGCIAYIDNLRNKNRHINYKKPLKELNNLSIEDLETKYIIVLKNIKTGKIISKYRFYFFKNQYYVSICPFGNDDNILREINKTIPVTLIGGKKINIKTLYNFVYKNRLIITYNYSPIDIT